VRDLGLVDRAAQALDASGLPAERLIVEVTEAAAYAEPQEPVIRNLSALSDLGVGLAIDDIGAPRRRSRTGHPDLDSWLWHLPVRLVKTDRGVTAVLGNPAAGDGASDASVGGAGRLLATAHAVATERDVPVVAKGIETPQQLAQLTRLGCPAGQASCSPGPWIPPTPRPTSAGCSGVAAAATSCSVPIPRAIS
jgi:EAL domain-containing protein (putative c-di-GMP-specific phosphodiesterase class I)